MELSFKIRKDIDTVFAYLSDMQKFASIHPVISSIEDLGNAHYKVHETLKLGLLSYSFTYKATVTANKQTKSVIIRASVFGLVKIEVKFHLIPTGEYTNISEQVTFTTLLPIQTVMAGVFKKYHTELFKNLEATQ